MRSSLVLAFFLSSVARGDARVSWTQEPVRSVCRVVLAHARSPTDSLAEGLFALAARNEAARWDRRKFWSHFRALESGKADVLVQDGSVESLLAAYDYQLQGVGFPFRFKDEPGALARLRRKQVTSVLKKTLKTGKPIQPSDRRDFARGFYALSRRVPLDRVELFLNSPNASFQAGVDYLVAEAFLEYSLDRTLALIGIDPAQVSQTAWAHVRRDMEGGVRIAAAFAGMGVDVTVPLPVALKEAGFFKRVDEVGYLQALDEFRPLIRQKVGNSVKAEMFVLYSSALVSMSTTYYLMDQMLASKEPPPEITDAEIREALVEAWRRDQERRMDLLIEDDDADLLEIRKRFEAMDLKSLRESYQRLPESVKQRP